MGPLLLTFLFREPFFHVGVSLRRDSRVLFRTGRTCFLTLIDVAVETHLTSR